MATNPATGTSVPLIVTTPQGNSNPAPFQRTNAYTKWDFTTAIGVDLLPFFVPVQVPAHGPQIPPHFVYLDVAAQNIEGNPPGVNGGPKLGFGVTIPNSAAQNKGKYYFEIEYTQRTDPSNGFPATFNGGIAIGPSGQDTTNGYGGFGAQYNEFGFTASTGVVCLATGRIVEDGNETTGLFLPVDENIGSLQEGDIIAVAVNLDAGLVWFQCIEGPSAAFSGGDWNGVLGSDPNTLTFGATLSSTSNILPYAIFGGETYPQAVTMQANFGFVGFFIESTKMPLGYRPWPTKTVT